MSRRILAALLSFTSLGGTALAQAPAAGAPAPLTNPAPAETSSTAPAGAAAPALPAMPGNLPDAQMSFGTLEVLHRKGVLTDDEYAAALRDLADLGNRAKTENTLVVSKFATTFYGFLEGEFIHDDTRSYTEIPGSGAIIRPGVTNSDLGRTLFSVRNSRLGFRLAAPTWQGIRASAFVENDFFGNQPGTPQKGLSESAYYQNPQMRLRHALLKVDSDIVNVWVGQTWELVGFQGGFQPNTVGDQGVPGELYNRTPQLRLDKVINAGPVAVELAAAALRPPQQDSMVPDLQGGLKLSFPGLTGISSVGAASTSIAPAAIALTGGSRHFRLPNNASDTTTSTGVDGRIVALDVLVPVIPAKTRGPWAVTLVGEAVSSTGYASSYTGLNGGAGVGSPVGVDAAKYAAGYTNVDPGLVGWSKLDGALTTVSWRTLMVSGQIYLPPSGKLWLAGAYSNSFSDNMGEFVSPKDAGKKAFNHEIWWSASLLADVTPATRFGLEYQSAKQTYLDGIVAANNRVELTGFFIF